MRVRQHALAVAAVSARKIRRTAQRDLRSQQCEVLAAGARGIMNQERMRQAVLGAGLAQRVQLRRQPE